MPTLTPLALDVSLQEITASTVRAVTDLRVAPEQEAYVASNAVSIAQAHFHPEAWIRAVYAGADLVGFVMVRDETLLKSAAPLPNLSLWRFMIDHRFQKSGYGHMALDLVVSYARSRPGIESIQTSYVDGPNGPRNFYLAYGFRPTGEVKPNGEVCLTLELTPVEGEPHTSQT